MNQALCSKKKLDNFIFEEIKVNGYEKVLVVKNPKVNLTAIISIHNTALGPALGGTRIRKYPDFNSALVDVLRLSEGMTYKAAMSECGYGGGKSVIIADPATEKTPELLRAFGQAVDSLNGLYICAEDMGCALDDVKTISETTKYVVGLPHEKSSGDPSRYTAWGTFLGIKSVIKKIYNTNTVKDKTIAIQGLGSVGEKLVKMLYLEGAKLILTDVDTKKLKDMKLMYNAVIVKPDDIYDVKCDVFSPCALGGIINSNTIPRLKCRAIAGCANNQLATEKDGHTLVEKNILYSPDFVINAGGLINVAEELSVDGYSSEESLNKTSKIYDKLMEIYSIAEKKKGCTQKAAISLADFKIKYKIKKRKIDPVFHHAR